MIGIYSSVEFALLYAIIYQLRMINLTLINSVWYTPGYIYSFWYTPAISIFFEWNWSFLGKYSNKGGCGGGGGKFSVLKPLIGALQKIFCSYSRFYIEYLLCKRKDYYMHKHLLKFAEVAMKNTWNGETKKTGGKEEKRNCKNRHDELCIFIAWY